MVNAGRRLVAIALALGGVAGCASHADAPASTSTAPAGAVVPQHYTESISSVLLSDDGEHMAAIGSSHHYIFEAPPVLFKALHSPIHSSLTATFSTFHVDKQNHVTGQFMLSLPADAPAGSQQAAAAIGLVRDADGHYEAAGALKGQRYAGWTYRGGREQDKLNKAYTIDFTTDFGAADTAVDGAATPIRTAADGVQLLYWAPIAPIVLPFIFLTKARDH